MIDNLKDFIMHHNALLHLFKFLNNITQREHFKKRVNYLKTLSFFDYHALTKPIGRYYTDFIPENNDKCMSICLKQYMGIDIRYSLCSMIEHGLFFGDYLAPREVYLKVPSIITFGDQRIKHLKERGVNKEIIPIGPYIHYSKQFLSDEEFRRLKDKYGRILLVFPSHSLECEDLISSYNIDEFADEIDKVATSYDTVFISLHYSDVGLGSKYEERGYICVSSGLSEDPFFMQRQRSLIELSDMTMSNAVGTHVGYCIYLNKPHYIFKQKIEEIQDDNIKESEASRRTKSVYEAEIQEVEAAFNNSEPIITDTQRSVVNYYWGTDYIKTPEELKQMLTFCRW